MKDVIHHINQSSRKVNLAIILYGLIVFGLVIYIIYTRRISGINDVKDVTLVLTPIAALYITAFNIQHSNKMQSASRKAEAAQDWMEKTFLTEGIEPTIEYLNTMSRLVRHSMKNEFVEPHFPMAALIRMTLLFRHDRLLPLVMMLADEFRRLSVQDCSKEQSDLVRVMHVHQKITELLLDLEGIILVSEVNDKMDVLKMHKMPRIDAMSETVKEVFETMFHDQIQRENE